MALSLSSLLVAPMPGWAASPSAATARDTVPHCSWDRPGHNPFMGDVVAAVDRYTDIPADVRARFKQRMAKREYDDIASIKRDSIDGKYVYEPAIRDMHFGVGRICSTVSRSAWMPAQQERGLVYCEGTECIIVPTVCRNVSRVKREAPVAMAGPDLLATAAAPPGDELLFDPPGAGMPEVAVASAPESFGERSGGFAGPSGSEGWSQGAGVAGGPGGGGGGDFPSTPDMPSQGGRVQVAGGGRLPESGGSPLPGGAPPAITAVPEPGTWALMLMGLAACGLGSARRRTASATRP